MSKVQWTSDLSVGIEEIDTQHRAWIAKFNAVLDAVEQGRDQGAIISTLDFLLDYTDEHFRTEEEFMAAKAFTGLAAHKAKHQELKSIVTEMAEDFRRDGVSQQLADAIGTLMSNWLVSHIREMDMAYARSV